MLIHEEYQYLELLEDALMNGVKKSVHKQEGVYVLSVFGRILRFDLSNDKIPIYTTKQVFWKKAFKEMLMFLSGDVSVRKLLELDILNLWGEFAYKQYKEDGGDPNLSYNGFIERIKTDDEFNKQYGEIRTHYKNMVNFRGINQIEWVLNNIKNYPHRKHNICMYWDPSTVYEMSEILENTLPVVLPACHMFHQINIANNKLSLRVDIRSNDLFLGNPFNVAQYALLTRIYCKLTGYEPGELVITIGDAHIYSNQIEQVKIQLNRSPFGFPLLEFDENQKYTNVNDFNIDNIIVKNYNYHERLLAELVVVGGKNE